MLDARLGTAVAPAVDRCSDRRERRQIARPRHGVVQPPAGPVAPRVRQRRGDAAREVVDGRGGVAGDDARRGGDAALARRPRARRPRPRDDLGAADDDDVAGGESEQAGRERLRRRRDARDRRERERRGARRRRQRRAQLDASSVQRHERPGLLDDGDGVGRGRRAERPQRRALERRDHEADGADEGGGDLDRRPRRDDHDEQRDDGEAARRERPAVLDGERRPRRAGAPHAVHAPPSTPPPQRAHRPAIHASEPSATGVIARPRARRAAAPSGR